MFFLDSYCTPTTHRALPSVCHTYVCCRCSVPFANLLATIMYIRNPPVFKFVQQCNGLQLHRNRKTVSSSPPPDGVSADWGSWGRSPGACLALESMSQASQTFLLSYRGKQHTGRGQDNTDPNQSRGA